MKPRPTTDADLAFWADYEPKPVVIGGPPSEPDCIPCPALITRDAERDQVIIRVPFELDEIEVAHLARGGTLWLSTWGGLPIHMVEVQEPTTGGPLMPRVVAFRIGPVWVAFTLDDYYGVGPRRFALSERSARDKAAFA